MTSLRIPSPLQPYVEGSRQVDVSGSTVAEAVQDLTERYPLIKNHLCSKDGALRPYVHIYRNDTNVRELEGMETVIGTHDRLLIVPSIAGGSYRYCQRYSPAALQPGKEAIEWGRNHKQEPEWTTLWNDRN